VYHQANDALGAPAAGPLWKIKPLTEILEAKRLKHLGMCSEGQDRILNTKSLLSLYLADQNPKSLSSAE
jgi:hypothetical protein